VYNLSMAVTKKIFKIEGMDCPSCAMMVDDVLEEMPGVLSSKTNYAKSRTEVCFEEEKVASQDIASSIEQGGFTVTSS